MSNPSRNLDDFKELSKEAWRLDLSNSSEIRQFPKLWDHDFIYCEEGPDYITYLDGDEAMILCIIQNNESMDARYIKGSAYCGNNGLTFGKYAMLTIHNETIRMLESIDEIIEAFTPIDNEKKAAAVVLLTLDNIDQENVYIKKVEQGYQMVFIEYASSCSCGDVKDSLLEFMISSDGDIHKLGEKTAREYYRHVCAG